MKLVEFPDQNATYAKHQPEYLPLPCHKFGDLRGTIACCWAITWRERLQILLKGRIWHRVLTFGNALQPQLLTVQAPDFRPGADPLA